MNAIQERERLIESIQEKDFNKYPDLKLINEACGIEVVKKLLFAFQDGVEDIYIPRLKALKPLVTRYIKENPHLSNKEIARVLDTNQRYVAKVRKELFNIGY